MRGQAIGGVVDKDPFVEVHTPVNLGTFEILRNLRDGLRCLQFIWGIDLEQAALRFEEAVILTVTLIPPRAAGHEVGLVGQPHESFKESLKLISLAPEK